MRSTVLALSVVLAACGAQIGPGGHDVGGFCMTDKDCAHQCIADPHFPGGLCSESCNTDADCPNGAACIDEADGVCAVQCGVVDGNCSGFGGQYVCDMVNRKAKNAQLASVCQVITN